MKTRVCPKCGAKMGHVYNGMLSYDFCLHCGFTTKIGKVDTAVIVFWLVFSTCAIAFLVHTVWNLLWSR